MRQPRVQAQSLERVNARIDRRAFRLSSALRERGWLVPAYTFPEKRTDLAALRVVVKQGFSHDMADMLVNDLRRQLPRLEKQPHPLHDSTTASCFHH